MFFDIYAYYCWPLFVLNIKFLVRGQGNSLHMLLLWWRIFRLHSKRCELAQLKVGAYKYGNHGRPVIWYDGMKFQGEEWPIVMHCGSWEPPGRFLYYCKFLFSFVQASYAGIKIQLLKNISRSRFWKKSKINNFTSHCVHKIHWVGKKYFLTAYLNSWCYLLSFDRSHYIFL